MTLLRRPPEPTSPRMDRRPIAGGSEGTSNCHTHCARFLAQCATRVSSGIFLRRSRGGPEPVGGIALVTCADDDLSRLSSPAPTRSPMLTPYRARAAATSPDSAGAGYPGALAGSHSRPGTSRTTRPAAACAGPGTPDRPCLPARPGARASSAGAPKRSAPQLRTLAARCAGWPRQTGRPGPAPRPREAAATGPDAGPGPRDPGTATHLAPNATAAQLPELRLPLRGSGILPAGDLCWPRYREARAWLRLSRITPRGRRVRSPGRLRNRPWRTSRRRSLLVPDVIIGLHSVETAGSPAAAAESGGPSRTGTSRSGRAFRRVRCRRRRSGCRA
jgi:hypothetical protein